MEKDKLSELIDKYLSGECNAEEVFIIEKWYETISETEKVFYGTKLTELQNSRKRTFADLKRKLGITDEIRLISVRKNFTWLRWTAAASFFLAISMIGYFLLHKRAVKKQFAQNLPQDVRPGHNKATLTLANGQKIILSKGLSGKLGQQGNMQILVNGDKEVVYSQVGETAGVQYNTLSTTLGEQSPYPLVLADGTKVWLNANSSLTFPTAFNGSTREVKITGEAYFEVVHNTSKPFTVKAGNQTVEDIGTEFNINSYSDESAIITTLIKGSAKVIANGTSKILTPGHQSIVNQNTIILKDSDSETDVAWMSGEFVFHDEDLHSVMRQLARWYNIKVIYDYEPKNIMLGGGFPKSVNISKVLKAFEQTGAVKFKIQGSTVHIIQ